MFKPSLKVSDIPKIERNDSSNGMEDTGITSYEKFEDMGLPHDILRGIFSYGYESPSPIQKKAIKPIMEGKDLIAQAQSGTGKTATFTIGSLSSIDISIKKTQVICLSPTRELSTQICSVYKSIGNFCEGLSVHLLVGGISVDKDLNTLKNDCPHVIVGTPGRVYDMLRRRALSSEHIKLFLLDEADEMLSQGFKEQVRSIFQMLPAESQCCIFSATLPRYIFDITSGFMNDPVKITVKAEQLTLEGIQQFYVAMENDVQKFEVLIDLYSKLSVAQCIIYANSVKRVEDLYQALISENFKVVCTHSGMNKTDREEALTQFRSGDYRILISSNLTARGIDIQQVSCVINFDIPKDISTYLHRIGRSGRWGRKGVGINFMTEKDCDKLRQIERYYHTQINALPQDIEF